jgi:hypothetical protein
MFLLDLRKPFSEYFFPKYEQEIFSFYQDMLIDGLNEYHLPILSILHSFLLRVDVLNNSKNFVFLIDTISNFLSTNIWKEASKVLDVALRNSSKNLKNIKIFKEDDNINNNNNNNLNNLNNNTNLNNSNNKNRNYFNFENSSKGNNLIIEVLDEVKKKKFLFLIILII